MDIDAVMYLTHITPWNHIVTNTMQDCASSVNAAASYACPSTPSPLSTPRGAVKSFLNLLSVRRGKGDEQM